MKCSSRHATVLMLCAPWAFSAFACSDDPDPGPPPGNSSGRGGTAGSGGTPQGGAGTDAGRAGTGGAGTTGAGTGGMAGTGDAMAGAAGSAPDSGSPETCKFHNGQGIVVQPSDAGAVPSDAGADGADGADGAAGVSANLTVRKNALVGTHLFDPIAGRALYVHGADVPGDCKNQPVMNCTADCEPLWPPFHAEIRALTPELNDADFGSYIRALDGVPQTTYRGWPLYRFKNDATANDLQGHGKRGMMWLTAKLSFYDVLVMKSGDMSYLATPEGRALYTADTDGSGANPQSSCTGSCLTTWPFLGANTTGIPSTLDPNDFSIFARQDGAIQTAYRGAPLYFYSADAKPGDILGHDVTGRRLALAKF